LQDITQAVKRNLQTTAKEIQKGNGMDYSPMEVSLAAANLERVQAHVKKAKRDIEKFDNEKVNPFKVIASFPAIKARIDGNLTTDSNVAAINKLVGTYQLDNDDAYCFSKERQYAYFQSPFQAEQWANADVLFSDIDYTGCHHFPYLLNIACLNSYTSKYMACGRALLNRQDAISIGKALSVLVYNVTTQHHGYDVTKAHKEILIDFDDAEANAFVESFGQPISNLLRGCSVHFIRSTLRVGKVVNHSTTSFGYHIFMTIAKRIPDESSIDRVQTCFDVLCGVKTFQELSGYLSPNLSKLSASEVETSGWKHAETWVDWWRRPRVLKKLCKAYTALTAAEWDDLPATTNPVESINRQSIPSNVKQVSLKPLIEHLYLEDKRQAILQVASEANITISYHTKKRERKRGGSHFRKPPEKRSSLLAVPTGKSAVGTRVSVEFYSDDTQTTTTWYKGTVIAYSRNKGYVINFNGFGPEENESIRSLKKAVEKGEVKLI